MRVVARHDKAGLVYGTFSTRELPDESVVFSLLLDDAGMGDTRETAPDKFWFTIERDTLSDLMAEADKQGLWDVRIA